MIESLFLPLIAGLSLAAAQPGVSVPAQDSEQDSGPETDADIDTDAELAQSALEKPQAAPELSAENRAALRCSAAFAILANRTSEGDVEGAELRARGREFFVVTLAGLMDEHGLDRADIEREVRAEAGNLMKSGEADQIMPSCLLMLEAAGL